MKKMSYYLDHSEALSGSIYVLAYRDSDVKPFFSDRSTNVVARVFNNEYNQTFYVISSYIEVIGKQIDFDSGHVKLLVRYNNGDGEVKL